WGVDLAGDIVFGGTEPAGRDYDARAFDRVFDQLFKPGIIIADDGLELNVDADAIEFFSEPETVCVGSIRSEKFGANRDDFRREHERRLLPQRTRRKKTQREVVVFQMHSPDGRGLG